MTIALADALGVLRRTGVSLEAPSAATDPRHATARITAIANETRVGPAPSLDPAATTRIPATILPMVCPPAAVNRTKYPPQTSSRNAASGTIGSTRHWLVSSSSSRSVRYTTDA